MPIIPAFADRNLPRQRNLRAVARQRAFGQRLGLQAASSCFVTPKRGEAGWEGRNNTDFLTIENEPGRNNTAVCFHAGIVFGSCGLSPVPLGLHPRFCLRKSPAVVRGALYGTMADRLRRPSAVPRRRKAKLPGSQPKRRAALRSTRLRLRSSTRTREDANRPVSFFDRTEDDAGMGPTASDH